MSGVEVLGAAAASAQLFETVIRIFKSVNHAYKRHKELATLLDKYRLELERIRDLSESVKDQKAFKGAKISDPIARLENLELKLCSWLAEVDPGNKKSIQRFREQLLHGKDHRKKLDDIMNALDEVKTDLLLAINLHNTTMAYDMKAVMAKTKKAIQIGAKLEKECSSARGSNLHGTTRVRTYTQQNDSSESNIDSEDSGSNEPSYMMPRSYTSSTREVRNNEAEEGATMVNAPVGDKDLWAHIAVVKIEGNKVKRGAQMYNYRIDANGIALMRAEKEWQIVKEREQMLFEKQNGLGMYWRHSHEG